MLQSVRVLVAVMHVSGMPWCSTCPRCPAAHGVPFARALSCFWLPTWEPGKAAVSVRVLGLLTGRNIHFRHFLVLK